MESKLFKSKKAETKKTADTGLKAVLDSGSTLKLVKWIDTAEKNSGGGMYAILDNEYGQDIAANRDAYQEALNKHAVELGEHYKSPVPLVLCGSILEEIGVKVPTDLILSLDDKEIIDEFFGTCYQTRRLNGRYQPDFKQRIIEKVRALYATMEDMMNTIETDGEIDAFASCSTIDDMIELYGRSAVKLWWRTLSGEEAEKFSQTMTNDTWRYDLDEHFGANLEVPKR